GRDLRTGVAISVSPVTTIFRPSPSAPMRPIDPARIGVPFLTTENVLLPCAKAGARPVVLSQTAQKLLQRQIERTTRIGSSQAPMACPTAAFTSLRSFGRRPAPPALRISTSTIFGTTGRRRHSMRVYGADRDGPRRLEDGADDEAVRGGNGQDAPG